MQPSINRHAAVYLTKAQATRILRALQYETDFDARDISKLIMQRAKLHFCEPKNRYVNKEDCEKEQCSFCYHPPTWIKQGTP